MIEPLVAVRRIALPAVLAAAGAAGVLVPADAARRAPDVPSLESEHTSPSGAFTFRTPAGWVVESRAEQPETVNAAASSGLRVRFVHRRGEHGYDSLHGACMLERLAPPGETSPVIKYEYDYVDAGDADRRILDSAFVIRYDSPVHGHKEWRQRNVTVVGGGHSLCAVSYAPAPLWKKSKETRPLLDAVLGSVTFR